MTTKTQTDRLLPKALTAAESIGDYLFRFDALSNIAGKCGVTDDRLPLLTCPWPGRKGTRVELADTTVTDKQRTTV
ncbi:MAG: hypothetical protein ACNA74_07045, partial [Desulfurivibrio sp.]